ncbi:MAG: hypothetical protein ABIH82_04605 [Candidatus Woesearchaeota archaeon]
MTSTSSDVENKVMVPVVNAIDAFNTGFIDTYVDHGVEAILVNREGTKLRSLEPHAQRAKEKNVAVFVMGDGWQEHDGSAVVLPVSSEQYWGICRGLQKIVDQAIKETETTKQRYERIVEQARSTFTQPDFYDQTPFLDLMLNPNLRIWADKLEKTDKQVIVDCGHIDSDRMMSGNADEMSLEEGAVLVQHLRRKGFEAKLSVLYNEMRFFNTHQKQTARRIAQKLYQQAKREGTHYGVLRQYHYLLAGHGITPARHKDLMDSTFEGKLTLQCRQDLKALENGDKTKFVRDLDKNEGIYSYEVKAGEVIGVRHLTTASGAPNCAMLSAKLNQHHERNGAGRVLYLRDEMEWGCAVRNGAATARDIYGVIIPIDFVGYLETSERIATLGHKEVGKKGSISCRT